MNWVLVSLPLVASISLLLGAGTLYLLTKEMFRNVDVPRPTIEEPDVVRVREAFSKVFPQPSVGKEETIEVDAEVRDVKLLGTSVGVKNLALLRVGDKVIVLEEGKEKRGIRLAKVEKRSAVVELGGRRLKLKVESGGMGSLTTPPNGGTIGEGLRISRREIERLTRDPGIMFREIRLVPYVKNGKTEGFIFEWIKPGSLFHKAGLRKGDILISINNMTIKSGEDAFKILQVLRNEPSLRVVVLRNGQRQEINVRIE